LKNLLNLFLVFVKMGCITFGGGYAMMPVIERELIKKRSWVTMDEVLECYTIGQVTPGVIAVNVSTFIGYKRGGVAGAILATFGFVSLPVALTCAIAAGLANFASLPQVQHAFAGIRIAVGALILDTVIKMCRGAFKDRLAPIIAGTCFLASAGFSANPVVLVTAAGLGGFLLYTPRKKPPAAGEAGQ